MYRSQLGGGPAASGGTTPTSVPSSPRKDKESRQPLKLIARSPLHDIAVETDMMKHTVPSTTRSSTHPSLLTSSHPSFVASSSRSSSQPSLESSLHHLSTGPAHSSLITSAHFPAGSSHEFVHASQGIQEVPPSLTGPQGRPRHHSFHHSYSSQQQSLRRSYSDQPGMALSERSREEPLALSSSSLSSSTTGVHSASYVENPGDVEAAGSSSGGQRRYSWGQMSAMPPNLKERRVLSSKLTSGEQGWRRVPEECAGRSGLGAGGSEGLMTMTGASSGSGRDWESRRNGDLRRAMSSGSGSSVSHQEHRYNQVNHYSLEDLSSTSLLSANNPAPSHSQNLHPPPPPLPVQHHSVVAHHSHATSHVHVPTSHHQYQPLPSSHLRTLPHQQPMPTAVPLLTQQSLLQRYHTSSVSHPMDKAPGADLQPPLNRPPPLSHGMYGTDRQGHPQMIMLPPSMMASSVHPSSSDNGVGGGSHSSGGTQHNFQSEGPGGYPGLYSSECPNRQYQTSVYSSYHPSHPGTQTMNLSSSGLTRGYRSQGGWDSHTSSHRSLGTQFQPSLSTLDSHDPSSEGEFEPQGQSCFPEGETMSSYDQPMSLQVENRLSPPPPSGRGSSSAPSSLQSPSHQQQNQQDQQQQQQQQKKRPEHLDLDDYLAGETQRQLTLQGSGGESKHSSNYNLEPLSIEIIEHPRDATVKVHQKAVFTCKALVMTHDEGRKVVEVDVEPQLQWYKGELPLSNEVMKDLILCDVKDVDAGSYHCVVTHPHKPTQTTHSSKAQLIVKSTPSELLTPDPSKSQAKEVTIISEPPSKVNVELGQELQLVVEVKGEEPINYKWYKDLQVLDYCHKSVLRVPAVSPSDSGRYSCSITNLHSSVLSTATLVRVVQPKVSTGSHFESKTQASHGNWTGKPSIVLHPLSQQVLLGQNVYLNVEVGVAPHTCSFQWYKNHTPIEGQNRPVLIISAAKLSDAAEYYCSVANAVGMTDSNIAFVSVNDPHVPPPHHRALPPHHHAPPPHPSHTGSQFPDQPERQDELLRQYGGYSYSQSQPFAVQGGHIGPGEYFVNPAGGTGLPTRTGGMDYRGYNPSQNWQYRHDESTADEDQPGGQGESGTLLPSHTGVSNSSSSSSSSGSRIPLPDHTGSDDTLNVAGHPPSHTVGQPGAVDSRSERSIESGKGTRQFPLKMGNMEKLEDSTSHRGSPPKVLEQPQSQKVDIGEPLSLSCQAVGQGEITYLWYFNGLSIATETRPEYYINCFTDEDEGVYFCRISNQWGSIDSKMAQVSMKEDD